MLRGLSSLATRSWRNFRMRFACSLSSLPSSRSASAENSIFRAMALYHVLQRYGLFLAAAYLLQPRLGHVNVFEVLKMLQNRFAHVIRLGAPGSARQFFQPFLDGLRKSYGQHRKLAIQV